MRTRVRGWSQAEVAELCGVRQATISHIERGRSLPNLALVLEFCKHFDVSPTWLLDPKAPLVPRPSDAWNTREETAGPGAWIEIDPEKGIHTPDGKLLCPIDTEARIWKDEDLLRRRAALKQGKCIAELREEAERRRVEEEERLIEELVLELGLHPRRRSPSPPSGTEPLGDPDPSWKPA